MTNKILIIDDDSKIRKTLQDLLADKGLTALLADSGKAGLALLKQDKCIQTILLDIWMDSMSGIEVLQIIKKDYPHIPVIMISGHGNIELAVQALKIGAYDFLEKPFSVDKIYHLLNHTCQSYQLKKENKNLKNYLIKDKYLIIGKSKATKDIIKNINTIAKTNSRVIILGENGTGKELIARQIHLNSARAEKPFIAVNCAAIPDTLIESELFGHEKGSFTGAFEKTIGKFEQANQGTLFLDEIGDMSLNAQSKVLRALDDQKIQPVGGKEHIRVDVRVISATNKDLQDLITQGLFREDLYYRLAIIPIKLPPLRNRKDDIALLVDYFIKEFVKQSLPAKKISQSAIKLLQAYDWPGNVRELKNTVERLLILVEENEILPSHLGEELQKNGATKLVNTTKQHVNFKEAKALFERDYFIANLKKYDWNISETAKKIGVVRSYLHIIIKKYDIIPPNFKD
ncbi:MAG: sigma-54-dependent Fis family transcriptional regulator [SAR324 cluster bacterium]|nr:sigma-54-dependent Fis family transcriptional regulator [SAR324 cluster bacterium]